MAKQSDVTLKLSGISGVTPTGITVSYQLGHVPTAHIDLAPDYPGVIKIYGNATGLLQDVDGQKRKEDVSADLKVTSWVGATRASATKTTRTLKFVGLLDGLSLSNLVGGNSYQAVLKGKAQTLLELTTHMPGLYPTSVNIYKNPSFSQIANPQGGDDAATSLWIRLTAGDESLDPSKYTPIEVYTKLMQLIIEKQQSGWKTFLGRSVLVDGQIPFEKIFTDARYQKALTRAKKLFANIDLTAVNGGALGSRTGASEILSEMKRIFIGGSNILLENYMGFLSTMGCTLIFSNEKLFVVPINSVLKQEYTAPGVKQLQKQINHALPADYSGYSYSDNGYRDIAHVIVSTRGLKGSTDIVGSGNFARGDLAHYSDENNLTQASGVLVVNAHPFMLYSPFSATPEDAKKLKQSADSPKKDLQGSGDFDTDKKAKQEGLVARQEKKDQRFVASLKDVLKNYAETKFYQARYGDRQGSITMDFNPQWVPGTSGSLYVRETGTFVAFYVTGVTHRIEMGAPHNGTAMTSITFCCGRTGASPPGVEKDMYLGYNLGKEQAIQKAFVADIGAT